MEIVHYHFTSLDSTNTWGKNNASECQYDKITLITAEEQTGGRGRQGRSWFSPKGKNVYASLCLFAKEYNPQIGNITNVLALAALKVLEKHGFHAQLKWPNDLLLSEKKVGGVMCETRAVNDRLGIILGVGINVNMSKDLLDPLGRPATSLLIESGHSYDVQEIIQQIAQCFATDVVLFLKEGFQPFLNSYKQHLAHKPGQRMRFHVSANKLIEGTFHSIGDNGSLNLQLDDGSIRNFLSGDII